LGALGGLVFSASVAAVVAMDPNTDGPDAGQMLIEILVGMLIVSWLYLAGLESSAWQGTVGKRLLGLSVTDREGRRISFLRATVRYAARSLVLLTVFIGFLIIALPSRRGIHDLIAGTLVVHHQPSPAPALPARRGR
jgi:uncharacterized RDD family membrane protein YckC